MGIMRETLTATTVWEWFIAPMVIWGIVYAWVQHIKNNAYWLIVVINVVVTMIISHWYIRVSGNTCVI